MKAGQPGKVELPRLALIKPDYEESKMTAIAMKPEIQTGKNIATSADLYARYRLAKAEYERAIFAGTVAGEECEDAILNPLSEVHEAAMRAIMLCPSESLSGLVRKIEVFQEEELQYHYDAKTFVAHLAVDGRELLRWGTAGNCKD
jgi:hypothetical protein